MSLISRILLASLFFFSLSGFSQEVWVIGIKGGIGPATSDFVTREISRAEKNNAEMVILQVDTPGGLGMSMRHIIQAITVSPIPIATWVGPSGARAASAGTYILFASHFASMAPGTNLGAATPVSIIGGMPGKNPFAPPDDEDNKKPAEKIKEEKESIESDTEPKPKNDITDATSALKSKAINDAAAYIQSLAKLHGRNSDWAEQAVRKASSIDAEEALKQNVIDYIAVDLKQVVSKANGRTVKINGVDTKFTLDIDNVTYNERKQDWRYKILSVITDPNVTYILLLIGIYGLLLEFYSPGVGLPGVLGGICLLLAMYSLQMLPVSYAGLGLLILGIILMVAEALSPSFGVLGFGGIIGFVLGSIMLMDTEIPGYQIAVPIIATFTLVSVIFCFVIIALLLKTRRRPVETGVGVLIGEKAVVVDCDHHSNRYRVHVAGEVWRATSASILKNGQTVTIVSVNGLCLTIKP